MDDKSRMVARVHPIEVNRPGTVGRRFADGGYPDCGRPAVLEVGSRTHWERRARSEAEKGPEEVDTERVTLSC